MDTTEERLLFWAHLFSMQIMQCRSGVLIVQDESCRKKKIMATEPACLLDLCDPWHQCLLALALPSKGKVRLAS